MSVSSARGKRADPLVKKVPENPKYKHVRRTLDTGSSITRYMEKMEELKRDYKFRKDEIFKRMKITTFVQLVIQVADYDSHFDEKSGPLNGAGEATDRPDTADLEVQQIQRHNGDGESENEPAASLSPAQSETSRSRLEQVIHGVGEVDMNKVDNLKHEANMFTCPYLLLDIRDKDAYDECHIITAKSYPIAMLSRSVNYEIKDMLSFKNQEGKIILLYDDDEKISHRAATTLVERGYDNLFMLSGGLKVAYKLFPEGLITGTIPANLIDASASKPKGQHHATATPRVPANKTNFSHEDIDKLAMYIDLALSDNSSASRLSKRSKDTGRSSTMSQLSSSSTTSSVSGRKPFKL